MTRHIIRFISALCLLAALSVASCSRMDETAGITFTATLAPKDGEALTKAITPGKDGDNKDILNVAWVAGEEVAVYYQKTDGTYDTATAIVGAPNADGSAPIIATLDDAKSGTAKFVYPASLADASGGIEETKLLNQNGNLTGANGISTKFDAATGEGTITVNGSEASVSGTVSLTNQVCICKFRFDIVESYGMGGSPRNFSPIKIDDDNGNTYTITSDRDDGAGGTRGFNRTDDIYVALLPVSGKNVTFSTTYDSKDYSYGVMNTTLDAGKFYRSLSIDMVKGGHTTYPGYSQCYMSTVTIPASETLTLDNTLIEVSSGPAIECLGNATIILLGANRVTTSDGGMAAIFIPAGHTLTIQGEGSLTTESTGDGGAGIGGGCKRSINFEGVFGVDCGNIVIESGTVTAMGGIQAAGIGSGYKGTCGAITINGGTVTATGGTVAAGIGSGFNGTCGTITIGSGLTSLTATMGYGAVAPIGSGYEGFCGTVTIDGLTTWTAGTATEHYTWTVSTVKDSHSEDVTRWTLTHK